MVSMARQLSVDRSRDIRFRCQMRSFSIEGSETHIQLKGVGGSSFQCGPDKQKHFSAPGTNFNFICAICLSIQITKFGCDFEWNLIERIYREIFYIIIIIFFCCPLGLKL